MYSAQALPSRFDLNHVSSPRALRFKKLLPPRLPLDPQPQPSFFLDVMLESLQGENKLCRCGNTNQRAPFVVMSCSVVDIVTGIRPCRHGSK
ncbi:hypothetical protein Bca4012_010801 [Brassica carinata]|uniref:Uncharacterized protein n=1 Tax=Brassica carinata TaxID=52824 RepID=A0A8X7V0V4_BRACI|nr:hypothetical protein Bca52824_035707 [Brassica carinata]